MDTGKRHHLQDIYATDHASRDDYTPQISSEVIAERKREQRRQQLSSVFLGLAVLAVLVTLVVVVVNKFIDTRREVTPLSPIGQNYIPRYSLPVESQWVLDYKNSFADPTWDGEGERPFSTYWLKKAAFNVIMAEQAFELGQSDSDAYQQAALYYEQALEIMPELEGIKAPLSIAYFKQGKLDEARELLESAPMSDLTYDILNNLGAACIEGGAYERAEEYLKRSLELKPAYAEALLNLALLYKQEDRTEEATEAFQQYLDQRPGDSRTRYEFALFLTQAGNWELAADQLYEFTAQVKDDQVSYLLLARAESKLGHAEAAMEALRRGIQLADPDLAIGWMNESEFDQLRNTEAFRSLMQSVERP